MFGKKKALGFEPKNRTLEEINREYSQLCSEIGVATFSLDELRIENQRLETLIFENKEKIRALKKEAKTLAPPATPAQTENQAHNQVHAVSQEAGAE